MQFDLDGENMNEREREKLERLNNRIKKQNQAIKENYDRVSIILPKGTKDRITATGKSINGLINELVIDYLNGI